MRGPYSPFPLNGTTWFAFDALSKIVRLDDLAPGDSGLNFTITLHLLRGNSCPPQVVEDTLNSCGLAAGIVAIGMLKVMGGPLFAVLISVSVAGLPLPTLTLPKLFDLGLIFMCPFGVGVGVGVAVSVPVAVAVGVADAVGVALAV